MPYTLRSNRTTQAGDILPLFVYGTLMRREENHAMLGKARFLGQAWTAPAFELIDLGDYPAMVDGGGSAVAGELYLVPPPLLIELDLFEEVPVLYRREPIALMGGRAEAYLMEAGCSQALSAPRIPGGDWRRRDRARRSRS